MVHFLYKASPLDASSFDRSKFQSFNIHSSSVARNFALLESVARYGCTIQSSLLEYQFCKGQPWEAFMCSVCGELRFHIVIAPLGSCVTPRCNSAVFFFVLLPQKLLADCTCAQVGTSRNLKLQLLSTCKCERPPLVYTFCT